MKKLILNFLYRYNLQVPSITNMFDYQQTSIVRDFSKPLKSD